MSKNLVNEDLSSIIDDTPPKIKIKRKSKNGKVDIKRTTRKPIKKGRRDAHKQRNTKPDW